MTPDALLPSFLGLAAFLALAFAAGAEGRTQRVLRWCWRIARSLAWHGVGWRKAVQAGW